MGFDCSYQGIPSKHFAIKKAKVDHDFAEETFYSFIAFQGLDIDEHDQEILQLNNSIPDVKNWNYDPSSRMHDALVYILDPESYNNIGCFDELEKTFPYQCVMGEEVFSKHLNCTQGNPVRMSSSEFISKCVKYLKNINKDLLASNFKPIEMSNKGIYKIQPSNEYKYVANYFEGLLLFYQKMDLIGNVSVFVIND